jgi:hypothetical protein
MGCLSTRAVEPPPRGCRVVPGSSEGTPTGTRGAASGTDFGRASPRARATPRPCGTGRAGLATSKARPLSAFTMPRQHLGHLVGPGAAGPIDRQGNQPRGAQGRRARLGRRSSASACHVPGATAAPTAASCRPQVMLQPDQSGRPPLPNRSRQRTSRPPPFAIPANGSAGARILRSIDRVESNDGGSPDRCREVH